MRLDEPVDRLTAYKPILLLECRSHDKLLTFSGLEGAVPVNF